MDLVVKNKQTPHDHVIITFAVLKRWDSAYKVYVALSFLHAKKNNQLP